MALRPEATATAAAMFSLIETAELNGGVEPYAYLRDVLERINGQRQDVVEELLPMNREPQGERARAADARRAYRGGVE